MAGQGEFEFIRDQLRPLTGGNPAALGLADDAALLAPSPGMEQVVASDMLVAGVHFLEADTLDVAGYRALVSNLSDLAAMGAEPLGYLASIAWPSDFDEDARAQFVAGLAGAQANFPIDLLGGDTTSTSGPLTVSITVIGQVPTGQALFRKGARSGDDVWVSGTIGDATLGLDVVRGSLDHQPFLAQRYQAPEPRVPLGMALRGLATSCIDVSDGLIADAVHLAEQGGVGIELQGSMIPWSDPVLHWQEKEGEAGLIRLVTGGDDYELLFTVPSGQAAKILALSDSIGVALTWIGRVDDTDGVRFVGEDGNLLKIESTGFTHF
jgi:thiamine-monophosphate kinase